jgi:hypothetical protein
MTDKELAELKEAAMQVVFEIDNVFRRQKVQRGEGVVCYHEFHAALTGSDICKYCGTTEDEYFSPWDYKRMPRT